MTLILWGAGSPDSRLTRAKRGVRAYEYCQLATVRRIQKVRASSRRQAEFRAKIRKIAGTYNEVFRATLATRQSKVAYFGDRSRIKFG